MQGGNQKVETRKGRQICLVRWQAVTSNGFVRAGASYHGNKPSCKPFTSEDANYAWILAVVQRGMGSLRGMRFVSPKVILVPGVARTLGGWYRIAAE
jgi:hypothetical protein